MNDDSKLIKVADLLVLVLLATFTVLIPWLVGVVVIWRWMVQ